MKEFLLELLRAVATAAIPVCAAFLVQFLRRKSAQIRAQIDSLTAKKLLDEVTTAVTTAVTYVSQTYVDGLKKYGNFTREDQKIALDLAVERAKKLMTFEAKQYLSMEYGNVTDYLVSRAEAEVRRQKLEHPVYTAPENAETMRESQDVASVAAATAAATAAAVVQNAVVQTNPSVEGDAPVEASDIPVEGG